MNKNRKIVIMLIFLLSLVFIVLGTSYSFFNKNGIEDSKDVVFRDISVKGYSVVKESNQYYTLTVENDVTDIEVLIDNSGDNVLVNGDGYRNLSVGENTLEITVTENNKTLTYTLVVTREASSDATLKSLSVEGYEISPEFNSLVTDYIVNVPNNINEVLINVVPNSNEASFTVVGNDNLIVGENSVNIEVTAGNGLKKIYNVVVIKEVGKDISTDEIDIPKKSSDATLKSLSVLGYELSPVFDSSVTTYELVVSNDVSELDVVAVTNNDKASYIVDGNSGLVIGKNIIDIIVRAENGNKKIYNIIVFKEEISKPVPTATPVITSDLLLKDLSVLGYELSPVFDSNVTKYEVIVPNNVTDVSIIAVLNDDKSTYDIIKPNELVIGNNKIYVVVTNLNNETKTYTVNVIRKLSSDASLKSLSVEGYQISPKFSSDVTNYELVVETSFVNVLATANSNVIQKITGICERELNWEDNKIEIKVTAEDGTTKVYTINVINKKPTPPVITGGSSEWVNNSIMISVEKEGEAVSGVDYYEYYITDSKDKPSDSTKASGKTDNSIIISDEGSVFVYYRTVSKNGFKSEWSNNQNAKLIKYAESVRYDDSKTDLDCQDVQCALDKIDEFMRR